MDRGPISHLQDSSMVTKKQSVRTRASLTDEELE
jgi:hypothetical protein